MPGTVVFSWDCRAGWRPDFVAEQSDNLVGVYKIVASDIADSVAVTVSGGAGERKSRGEESGRGGFDGGLRQEQPGAPEKLVGDRRKNRASRTASTLQGDGLAPDLKRPHDAMLAQAIAELPRRDAQQGGGSSLDAVGPRQGLDDLPALRVTEGGEFGPMGATGRARASGGRRPGWPISGCLGRCLDGRGKVVGKDQPPARQDHYALYAIFQLPDIPGPIVRHHGLQGAAGDTHLAVV